MNKALKKAVMVYLTILAFILVVYGAIIWTWKTEIRIQEPFTVKGSLPDTLDLSPGDTVGPYLIKVANKGEMTYTATLYYSIEASPGIKFSITPPSGTSQSIKPGDSLEFEIFIEISKDSDPGTLIINWRIERS